MTAFNSALIHQLPDSSTLHNCSSFVVPTFLSFTCTKVGVAPPPVTIFCQHFSYSLNVSVYSNEDPAKLHVSVYMYCHCHMSVYMCCLCLILQTRDMFHVIAEYAIPTAAVVTVCNVQSVVHVQRLKINRFYRQFVFPLTMSDRESRRFSLRRAFRSWISLFRSCSFFRRNDESRSRRKHEKKPNNNAKKAPGSFSQSSQKVAKKSVPMDPGVCGSLEDSMLDMVVRIPQGVDANEWLATHMLALFDHVNALCGSVAELCTPVSCPIMSFPGVAKAYWIDDKGKRLQYPAMQYIDCVMSFCEKSRKNESIFPTKYGYSFSGELEVHSKKTMKLLWHCIGHLYTDHWDQMAVLNLRPQVAAVLSHMLKIATIYSLMDAKHLAVVSHTVSLVRSAQMRQNGLTDSMDSSSSSDRHNRVPSSKSGSWGGHPTPVMLIAKPVAQTC
uniref:MOB kinase activator-like 2 n=1 Tax=Steinernema glaseri TaxID=37863 RepID=A0A1I7ZE57_9BILA